jgi:plastocyanin domain-containing protein
MTMKLRLSFLFLAAPALALALTVAACSKSDASASGVSGATVTADGKHQVYVTANDKGFVPSSVEVKKGEVTSLVFKRTTDDTCAKEVVFPELKLTKELPLNQAVAIDLPVGEPRTLTFQCGMAMFKGKVVVQ